MTGSGRKRTLYAKFVLTILGVTTLVGATTLAVVVLMSAVAARGAAQDIQRYIRVGIESKGQGLATNHALVLTNLVNENALVDIQRVVARAVAEDSDVVYGLYVAHEGDVWAYTAPNAPPGARTAPVAPKPDAWKYLGLQKSDLAVKAEKKRVVNLFDQEILEIAVPVVDGNEQLGTLRYGISTARTREALAHAKARSEQGLRSTVVFLAAAVATIALLGMLLARRLAARITKPLSVLNEAANSLASGQREIRVNIHSGDELEKLGDSFNHMVIELAQSYGALEELNRSLEERVRERTAELAERNRGMRMVLDNVQEGLVTLSIDGVLSPERSAVVDRWFGSCEGGVTLWKYLQDIAPEFALELEVAWEAIAEDFLPLELSVEQLPRRLRARGHAYQVSYSPLLKNERFEGMLVVIGDVTERLVREREEAAQHELIMGLQRLMRDRVGFMAFFQETSRLLESVTEETDHVLLMRDIHTIKGNASLHGLILIAKLCHELETELQETGRLPTQKDLAPLLKRWHVLSDVLLARTAELRSDLIQVPLSEYQQVLKALERSASNTEALRVAERWPLEPVSRPFERLAEQAIALAARLGKGQLVVERDPGDVRLNAEAWTPFWSSMTHVIRNAIDHGLEPPEERAQKSKGPPTLRLSARETPNEIVIEVTDDGRGVNWEVVQAKARAHQLPHTTEQELTQALFVDGFTTREQAGTVSGRGVGLAAVQASARSRGGTIEFVSAPGKGTTCRFRFPRSPKEQTRPKPIAN